MGRTRIILSDLEQYKDKKNNIAKYRTKAGLLQSECASKLGVSQQYLSLYENNKHFPRSYEIDFMLDLIGGITFDELFNTGRFTTYISSSNLEELDKYIEEQADTFPSDLTEYDKRTIVINQILGMFFNDKLNK